jgi:hypothetical protein
VGTRARKLLAALLIAALVAPLVAASAAFAQGPGCPDCPPPASSPDAAPCHGTPLLYCCDDVATARGGNKIQPNKPPLVAVALPSVAVSVGASPPCLAPLPDDLRWRASPLRLSVVLRL